MKPVDWHAMFVPSVHPLELVVRGSVMYLLILAAFRVFRREAGSLSVSDLLVVVLIADAAQNAMAGEYVSITEGVILVATIFGWNVLLDALAYRSRFVYRLLHAPSLLLVRDGNILRRNLRSALMTLDDLREQLREQGVDEVADVRKCYLESDGRLSVIRADQSPESVRRKERAR